MSRRGQPLLPLLLCKSVEDALLSVRGLLAAQLTLPRMWVNKEALMRRARCKARALMTR
jgi:hypothetical protein